MGSTSPNPVRVAVIGTGLGSTPHLRALADLQRDGVAELVWLFGRNAQRLAAAPAPATAKRTTRLDDIWRDASVQAVLVLTPANTHLDLVREAAHARKHVLVEKPLEIDLPRARRLIETCEDAGVVLGVMLQHRLREGATALRALLERVALGEPTSAAASVRWWRPQSYYDEPGRGTLARDGGGVLITQAIHTLDLLLGLLGLPDRVTGAAGTSAAHRMECEDRAAALLHYAGGMVAVVQATTAAPPGYPERIEINGTLGSATLEAGVLNARLMSGEVTTAGLSQGSGGGADPMGFDHGAHHAVLHDFLHALRDGREPAVSGRSALDVQRLIAAIIASAESGRTVPLGEF